MLSGKKLNVLTVWGTLLAIPEGGGLMVLPHPKNLIMRKIPGTILIVLRGFEAPFGPKRNS